MINQLIWNILRNNDSITAKEIYQLISSIEEDKRSKIEYPSIICFLSLLHRHEYLDCVGGYYTLIKDTGMIVPCERKGEIIDRNLNPSKKQILWHGLRVARSCSLKELQIATGIDANFATNTTNLWKYHGLVSKSLNRPPSIKLIHDIGPIAPIVAGYSGCQRILNPNIIPPNSIN